MVYFCYISSIFDKNCVILHPISAIKAILHIRKMKVFSKIAELQNALFDARKEGKTIGLVPTMGALHEGHASLVRRSVADNDVTVVSVFVNPTQFNDKNDLKNYPRTLDADCRLLDECGALPLPLRRCTPLPTTDNLNILPSPLSWRVLIVLGISMECARW